MKKENTIIACFMFMNLLLFFGCTNTVPADLILKNGVIYTVSEDNTTKASAVAVKEGKIIVILLEIILQYVEIRIQWCRRILK